jgi:hypothetical protein
MALTPVPFADNWKDVFGSQFALPAQTAKTPPISIVAPASVNASNVVTINRTHELAMEIDWADGSPVEAHAAGGGVKTHAFPRLGSYRIRSRVVNQPDVLVDEVVRIATRVPGTVIITFAGGNRIDFLLNDAIYPITIQWGDGDTRYEESFKGKIGHTYPAEGDYVIQYMNAEAITGVLPVTVPYVPPGLQSEAAFSPPYPWEGFSAHQVINDWVEEQDLLVPEAWSQWTLAVKKQWLADEYG